MKGLKVNKFTYRSLSRNPRLLQWQQDLFSSDRSARLAWVMWFTSTEESLPQSYLSISADLVSKKTH